MKFQEEPEGGEPEQPEGSPEEPEGGEPEEPEGEAY